MTVVLGPGWPGILLHEAIGHGLEGDFNRKGLNLHHGINITDDIPRQPGFSEPRLDYAVRVRGPLAGAAHAATRHVPPSLRAEKRCVVCGRPFSWRRRWAKVWNQVKYCSDACRSAK